MSINFQESQAVKRLDVPEVKDLLGKSIREGERELEGVDAGQKILDLTYADTKEFPPPSWAVEEFQRAATGEAMSYTAYRGDPQVREDVWQNVTAKLGLKVESEENIILTPGTQGGLYAALVAMLNPGDTVLLPDPEYLSTERILRLLNVNVHRIPMEYEGDQARVKLENVSADVAKSAKALIFSHPNNPTGAVYTPKHVTEIAEFAVSNDLMVVADQLYCRLVFEEASFVHIANEQGMSDRTLTLLGPSKTESMTGYRIGVAVGPEDLIRRIEDVQSVTALRAPAYSQPLLGRWIRDDEVMVKERVARYQELRDYGVEKLNASPLIEVHKAYGTAYIFPKFDDSIDIQVLANELKRRYGIVVNPGYQFGVQGHNSIRLCVAQTGDHWEWAIDRILEVSEELSGK